MVKYFGISDTYFTIKAIFISFIDVNCFHSHENSKVEISEIMHNMNLS